MSQNKTWFFKDTLTTKPLLLSVFSPTITSSTSLIPSLLLGTEIGAMDEIFIRINLVHNKGHWLCYHRHKWKQPKTKGVPHFDCQARIGRKFNHRSYTLHHLTSDLNAQAHRRATMVKNGPTITGRWILVLFGKLERVREIASLQKSWQDSRLLLHHTRIKFKII